LTAAKSFHPLCSIRDDLDAMATLFQIFSDVARDAFLQKNIACIEINTKPKCVEGVLSVQVVQEYL
jgi:hypothetical protein